MVKPFNGNGDVCLWLKKMKLVAKTKKSKDLATIIPLFLEDQAFMVFDHMDVVDQEDADKIEKALLEAFSMDVFQAYDAFRAREWSNEPVDVFLADLVRLANLADLSDENLIKRAFVVGLPGQVSRTLRATARIQDLGMADISHQARILMSEYQESMCSVASRHQNAPKLRTRPDQAQKTDTPRTDQRKPILCWSCGQNGHISRFCPSKKTGNGYGVAVAPAVSPYHQEGRD